jgi:hypothetical protein
MDLKKIQLFNNKMGRPKYSKGGYIKKIAGRKYFDAGGIAANNTAPGVGNPSTQTTSGTGGGLGGAVANFLGTEGVSANTTQGTNAGQLNTAYTGANNAINAQVGLTNTVAPQATNAVNNQNAVANQELAMTQGAGPNPAQAELAQNTQTNVANQAALAAGQRGGSANVGLQTRQAAQTGAATQQAAVGQAATTEAQQQIAAQQNLANLSNNQVSQAGQATNNLNSAQQNEQNILQNANTSYNNAQTAMQSNLNSTNSQAAASGFGSITGTSEISGILNKGGSVGDPKNSVTNLHGHKKLDFIHKMAKMGLDHFDKGGDVQPAPTPQPKSFWGMPQANADTPPPQSNVQGAQQSMDNAFGGHGNYDDGGTVSDLGTENFAPSEASPAPDASAPASGGKKGGGGGLGAIVEALAQGGEVNPLVSAMQNSPTNLGNASYTGSSSSSGPTLPSVSALPKPGGSGAAQKAYNLYKKNTGSTSANPATGATPEGSAYNSDLTPVGNQMAGNSSSNAGFSDDSGGAADAASDVGDIMAAKGGEIWNIHPSQHAQYVAEHFKNYFSKGGESKKVEAMVSPGERYWNPREVDQIKHGADPMKLGTIVPGKDKVPGKDSLKNDTVPATLEEGGIVNPLHVEKTKNSDKARLFVLKSLKATGRHLAKPRSMS